MDAGRVIYRPPPYRMGAEIYMAQDVQDRRPWPLLSEAIPGSWARTQGEGITVAVLDTGLWQHRDLPDPAFAVNLSSSRTVYDRVGHGCIAPDDVVYTSSCGVQPIRTLFERVDGVAHFLQDGSVVKDVSRLGIFTLGYDPATQKTVRRKVQAVHKLPYSGPVVRVQSRESSLRFTPWHPVYIETSRRGLDRSTKKVRADELKPGDMLVLSRRNEGVFSGMHLLHLTPRWVCRHCGHEAKGGVRRNCRKCGSAKWHDGPVSRSLPLNEDMAYFMGLVVSDSHVMEGSKSIEFTTEDQGLADIFTGLCLQLFGREPKAYPDDRQPTTKRLRLHHEEAWSLCCNQFGLEHNKSRTVQFPELLLKSRPSVIYAFIAGMIEGDGHRAGFRSQHIGEGLDRVRVATGSLDFAKRLVEICRFLGVRASWSEAKPTEDGLSDEPSWSVRIGHCREISKRCRFKQSSRNINGMERRAVRVQAISQEPYDGEMYDLTVEGTSNYVANGVVVSNTHVAGTVGARLDGAGVVGWAPKCSIGCVKVLGDDGSGDDRAIAKGIRYAAEHGAHIINLSLGGGYSREIESACRDVIQQGVFVLCAAGNDGRGRQSTVGWPARLAETLAIASYDEDGRISEFSSQGDEVDIAFPGGRILSTWLSGTFREISGTSMATPACAGLVALLLAANRKLEAEGQTPESPVRNNRELLEHLRKHSKDVGAPGKDKAFGWGVPDYAGFVRAAPAATPPKEPPPGEPGLETTLFGFLGVLPLQHAGRNGWFVYLK